ncbi:MAG: V-type ATPase subunit [Oscillospiraceae bacterium]|nr:V-type ATPase subunit [Oscillospiraceae bacterium]
MAINKEDYLYISSLLRAREPRMLSRDKAGRMLDAPGFEDAAKMLTESGYEDMSQMTVKQIETALSERRAAVFHELETLVPDTAALDLFRLKYDYHNAKVLIKSEAMHRNDASLLSNSGRIAPDVMQKRFQEDRLRDLPGELGSASEEGRALLNRSANPQLSDFLLDKAYFREMNALAEALDSDFARGYVALLADSTNLRSAVRILRMGKDIGYLREALVSGGSVSEERLIQGISGEGLASVFAGSALAKAAQLGADAVSGGTLTAFELACDNAVAGYLADAKLCSFGEESVIAYLAGTENELTAVRMILTGRLSGVPSDTIRERLRDLYA